MNPYSYIMNNPLAGTDPTGYVANCHLGIHCEDQNDYFNPYNQFKRDPFDRLKQFGVSASGSGQSGDNGKEQQAQKAAQQNAAITEIGGQSKTHGEESSLTGAQKKQIYLDTLSLIGDGAKVAAVNLVHDSINDMAGWAEQFLHKDEGALGRVTPPVAVDNELVQEVANDIRKVGAVAAMHAPLMRGATAPKGELSRVGRWMSDAELKAMQNSGKVQAPLNGANATHVTFPSNPNSFAPPLTSPRFVEFDVPSIQLRVHDASNGWGRVFGPGSFESRLIKRQGGLPPLDMPPASNILVIM